LRKARKRQSKESQKVNLWTTHPLLLKRSQTTKDKNFHNQSLRQEENHHNQQNLKYSHAILKSQQLDQQGEIPELNTSPQNLVILFLMPWNSIIKTKKNRKYFLRRAKKVQEVPPNQHNQQISKVKRQAEFLQEKTLKNKEIQNFHRKQEKYKARQQQESHQSLQLKAKIQQEKVGVKTILL